MPRFFAMTARGLAEALETELRALGAQRTLKAPGGVFFDGNWAACYRANLRLRSASRVALPVLDFPAYSPDELYANVRKHDFTKYISPKGTISVEASVRDSGAFRDQRFVAMKIKDAVVDEFREKHGERPNVDADDPDLRILVRCVKNRFSLSVDTSGDALFKRGYRVKSVPAPLKEHVAAGLIEMTDWDRRSSIVDPMCGSGTFLIEAALIAMSVSPGSLRRCFAFQRFSSFRSDDWEKEVEAALDLETEELPFKFYGFDVDKKAVEAARANVKKAGLENTIEIERRPFQTLEAPCESGTVITNPPYGERLGEKSELIEAYKDFAFLLKSKFKGWPAWVLSGDSELSAAMKLKAERRIPAFNGKIECRFLKYNMF